MNNILISSKYFKEYREKLGFTNQQRVKSFFGAKDIVPNVDLSYIDLLNKRLCEIIEKINTTVHEEVQIDNLEYFYNENIYSICNKLRENEILSRLNNQGRRPEEVYFSWMRGYIISIYFLNSLSEIFEVDTKNIDLIGDDDLINIDSFKRTPKADLHINLNSGEGLRVEVQSGFQGINDIKQHKVLEARKIKREENISSIIIHFDLFNGQVAIVKMDDIDDDNINWITRQQMEGQTVFNIDQNYFIWKLLEKPPKFNDLNSLQA